MATRQFSYRLGADGALAAVPLNTEAERRNRRSSLGTNGRFWRCIGEADWRRLEAAALGANFWALDAVGDEMGLDGAT
jgi:hypothetical protein